jgi:hypothetical protein
MRSIQKHVRLIPVSVDFIFVWQESGVLQYIQHGAQEILFSQSF